MCATCKYFNRNLLICQYLSLYMSKGFNMFNEHEKNSFIMSDNQFYYFKKSK